MSLLDKLKNEAQPLKNEIDLSMGGATLRVAILIEIDLVWRKADKEVCEFKKRSLNSVRARWEPQFQALADELNDLKSKAKIIIEKQNLEGSLPQATGKSKPHKI